MADFRISVDPADIDDLRRRLDAARWPDDVTGEAADWDWGTPPAVLRPLVERWREGYDFAQTQERWNLLQHVRVDIDGVGIHAIRAGTPGQTPLLLIHGWPDGFLRFERVLPLLADRFDIVIPSIPGFGFSDRSASPGMGPVHVADLFLELMSALGFERFGVHGADVGSTIAEVIAQRAPGRVIGLHLGDVPAWHRYAVDPATAGPEVRDFLAAMGDWFATEGAYAQLQRTKPQTLGYALNDSPLGLLAWIAEKFQAWSDGGLGAYSEDEILDDVSLYWFTKTAASSARYYREGALTPPDPAVRVEVPVGLTIFPKDIGVPPREYAELFFDVRRFTLVDRGGHFGPWEQPAIFAADLRAFFDSLA